ncbi:MAG: SH3 domain-containing protein, partial [Clostridiaceae bacterium]
EGAGTEYKIIGYLVNGQTIEIIGETGNWYNIKYNNIIGFVSKEYINEVSSIPETISAISTSSSTASKGQVINTTTSLRIRSSSSLNSGIIGYLTSGKTFDIIKKVGEWYNIEVDGINGFVYQDYVKELTSSTNNNIPLKTTTSQTGTEEYKMGTVYNVSTNLRLRSKASTDSDSKILAYLLPGATFRILEVYGEWYKVDFNGSIGYLLKDYVKIVNGEESTAKTSAYDKVLSSLKAQIGSPYVYGGSGEYLTTESLNNLKSRFPVEAARGMYTLAEGYVDKQYRAFDCSGLVQWGYKQAGITIGRTTWSQINNGIEVAVADARPGDLLFYGDISHVGMYIGNGQWIEAPNSRSYVRISNVDWSRIGRARRIIN